MASNFIQYNGTTPAYVFDLIKIHLTFAFQKKFRHSTRFDKLGAFVDTEYRVYLAGGTQTGTKGTLSSRSRM